MVILGIEKTGQEPGHDISFKLVDARFAALAVEHNAYFDDWIDGDPKVLSSGRDRFSVQRAFKRGTTRM